MARKKLTPAQRAAAKQRQYVRSQYNLTIDALDYLNMMGANINYKLVSKPTKASLNKIRRIYNQATKKLKQKSWVLPTKKEMAHAVREEQPYRKSRGQIASEQPSAPTQFSPAEDYISALMDTINEIKIKYSPDTTQHGKYYNDQRLEGAQQRLLDSLAYGRTKLGDEGLADALAANDYISRIEQLENRYAFQVEQDIDDDLIPLMRTAVEDALAKI